MSIPEPSEAGEPTVAETRETQSAQMVSKLSGYTWIIKYRLGDQLLEAEVAMFKGPTSSLDLSGWAVLEDMESHVLAHRLLS